MKQKIQNLIKELYLHLIVFISLSATLGSLVLSEIIVLQACDLCWFQRIFMYPIAFVSILAVAFKDKFIDKYILSLSIPGALISGYHYVLQMSVKSGESSALSAVCSPDNPCSETQLEIFGFITIPLMSFAAFAVIIILILAKQLIAKKS
jgi:disulfide bond formation protein DsbB